MLPAASGGPWLGLGHLPLVLRSPELSLGGWRASGSVDTGGSRDLCPAAWRTRLSDFLFTFHFHALEKEMATHSSVLVFLAMGHVAS